MEEENLWIKKVTIVLEHIIHEAKEFKLEEALQDYKLYDNKGNVLPATIRNLPRVFSIFINNRQTHEFKIDIHKQVNILTPAQITDYTTTMKSREIWKKHLFLCH